MSKFLTILLLVFIIITAILSIIGNEKKRKQDKTVLVDTTRGNWVEYQADEGINIVNDSTITISCDPFDDRLDRLEKKAAQLQKEINRIKRKLDVYFAPDTFSIEAAQPGDFILLADTITWKDGILNDTILWKAASITDTILWKAN